MRKLLSCLLVAGLVAIAGCKKEGAGTGPGVVAADDPLTYVPADTPYVFANIDPVPADVSASWIDKMDKAFKIGDMYVLQIDMAEKAIRDQAAKDASGCASTGGGGSVIQDAATVDKSADSDANQDSAMPAAATSSEAGQSGDASVATAADPAHCAQANADREKTLKLMDAFKVEVAGKDIKGLMDLMGVNMQAHVALYGIGLVPVMRIELAKPDNLRATIGRVETASGSKMATGKAGSLDYWIVDSGKADAPLRVVFAISGKQLVATVAPAKASDADLKTLDAALQRHIDDPRLVAVGEIGLDFFVPALQQSPLREKQEHFYREQLKLARKHGLPVILHVRRSADKLLKHLRELVPEQGWSGIAHAFNGSQQQALEFIKLGFKLGFGGAVTFEPALQLRRLATELPINALVMETDAPDIPPHWVYRTAMQRAQGEAQGRNEPGELPRIAQQVAQLRGMSIEALALATTTNALEALPKLRKLVPC